jgi:hypothetical protein
MSAITIGLVAATIVSLAVYRIRHAKLALLLKSRADATGSPGKPAVDFASREELTKRKKQTVIVSPMQDLEDRMIVILTVVFTLTALYIILSKQYGESEQKFAAGIIGTVIGFWFKTGRKP